MRLSAKKRLEGSVDAYGKIIYRELSALGSTPREVAERLIRAHFKGEQHEGYDCPVSKFLKLKTRDLLFVSSAAVRRTADSGFICTPPKAVADFIELFDAGRFKVLIRGAL